MKSAFIILCLLCAFNVGHSQESNRLRINSQDMTLLSGCLYDTFLDGKVFYKEGGYGKAKLNYNCITQEMLFINPQNDTLKLIKPEATSFVTITTDTFCFFKSTFLKKATHSGGPVNLFRKMDLRHTDNEKRQAYGTYSSVTGDQSSTIYGGGGITTYLKVDQNLVYSRSKDVYVSTDNQEFLQLKLASFNKIYPQYRAQIASFVRQNKIDWDEINDVIKLMDYIQHLPAVTPPMNN